jgi:hypothetical protein
MNCASFHPPEYFGCFGETQLLHEIFWTHEQDPLVNGHLILKRISVKEECDSIPKMEAHSTERNMFENTFPSFSKATKQHTLTAICKKKTSLFARNTVKTMEEHVSS